MTDATRYQQRLVDLGFLAPNQVDGVFGSISMDAFNRYRATEGLPPLRMTTLAELERTLFPKPVHYLPLPSTNPLAILWALLPVFTKGTAMSNDQLQGIARTLIAAAIPYAVAKGWIPAGSADLIVTAGVAVLVAIWSVVSKKDKPTA